MGMMLDSVLSWLVLTAASLFGIAKFLLMVIEENERRLMDSEEAWRLWEERNAHVTRAKEG